MEREMPKAFWKSKTLWFNVLSAAVMAGQGALGIHIPPNVAVPLVAVGNMGLRMITSAPLAVADPPAY